MIARQIPGDGAKHGGLVTLANFSKTCKRFYATGIPVLYEKAVLRYPYLLAWAAEYGMTDIARRLLENGAGYPVIQSTPLYKGRLYTGQTWPDPVDMPASGAAQGFRERYLITDNGLKASYRFRKLNFPTIGGFCRAVRNTGSAALRFRVAGQRAVSSYPRVSELEMAAKNGHLDIVKLLAPLVDLDQESSEVTIFRCHSSTSELFMNNFNKDRRTEFGEHDRGATTLNTGPPNKRSPYRGLLHHAVGLNAWEISQELFSLEEPCKKLIMENFHMGGTDIVGGYDSNGITPFWMACCNSDWLYDEGADVNHDLGRGFTPLSYACMMGKWRISSHILDMGGDKVTNVPFQEFSGGIVAAYEYCTGMGITGARPIDFLTGYMFDQPTKFNKLDVSDRNDKFWAGASEEIYRDYYNMKFNRANNNDNSETRQLELLAPMLDMDAELCSLPTAERPHLLNDVVFAAAQQHDMAALEVIVPHPKFKEYAKEGGGGSSARGWHFSHRDVPSGRGGVDVHHDQHMKLFADNGFS
ncbi:hypothetical protein OQA88_724 [Cercophora sp. LCS_1]